MSALYSLYWLAGLACAGLLAYLLVALWRAEEF
jgi:K+-transporting ATPase KdpF subunit